MALKDKPEKCTCGLCTHDRLNNGTGDYEDMRNMLRLRAQVRIKNISPEYVEAVIDEMRKNVDDKFDFTMRDWFRILGQVIGLDPDLSHHKEH